MKHDVSKSLAVAHMATFFSLLIIPAMAWAQLPTAQLTSVFPPGGKQGTTVEVTIAGTDLDDSDKLVFNHPGLVAQPKMSPTTEFEN